MLSKDQLGGVQGPVQAGVRIKGLATGGVSVIISESDPNLDSNNPASDPRFHGQNLQGNLNPASPDSKPCS